MEFKQCWPFQIYQSALGFPRQHAAVQIPTLVITMRKSTHRFPFLPYLSMGAPLGGRRSSAKKLRRLPAKLLHRDFFHCFNILNLILIMLCIEFVSFLKGHNFERISKKKHDFEKGMHSSVSNVGFIETHPMKNRLFFTIKKPEMRPIYIGSYPISPCAIYSARAF